MAAVLVTSGHQSMAMPAWVRRLVADPAVRLAVGVVLVMRVALGIVAALANLLPKQLATATGVSTNPLIGVWQRDDALIFAQVAHGYSSAYPAGAAFLPGYPAAEALAGFLTGSVVLGGLLVSTVCTVAALVMLFHLVEDKLGIRIARRTVVLFAVGPTAFFLIAPFSESLFLVEVLGCFTLISRGRLGCASIAAVAAILTRDQGCLLAFPLLIAGWEQFRVTPSVRMAVTTALRIGAAPMTALAGIVVAWRLIFNGWWPMVGEAGWGTKLVDPVSGFVSGVQTWLGSGHPEMFFNVASVVVLAGTLVFVGKRFGAGWAMWQAGNLLLIVCHETAYSPLMSASRFILCVPLVWAALAKALDGRSRALQAAVMFTSALCLGVLTCLFVSNRFVG
jgi:hypothetical protein